MKFRSMTQDCIGCGKVHPTAEFLISNSGNRSRYRKYCRECWRPIQQSHDRRPANRLSQLRSKARDRGTTVELNLEEYSALIAKPCDYCEGPLPLQGGGLDRRDSDKPYTVANCVPACAYCNEIKGRALEYEEMKMMGQTVKLIRLRRERLGMPPLMSHLQIGTTLWMKKKGRQ